MLKNILWLFIISLCISKVEAQTKVTFRVNMKYEVVSPDGVHVPGNFQTAAGMPGDWDPSDSLIEAKDPDNDKIYELTVFIPPGNYEYMYVNSNSWIEGSEIVPENCKKTGTDFRELIVGTNDLVLNVVCFSSCNNCPAFLERNVTLLVVDTNKRVKNVKLKGSMSDWNFFNAHDDGLNGDKKANDYIFTAVYKIKKGTYQWNGVADSFELIKNKNLWFTVDSAGHIKGDTVYGIKKLGALIDVTFNIDMSKEKISNDGVYISGDFLEMLPNPIKNWTRDTLKLLPRIGDSLIYTAKVKMYASKFAWKVWNGNNKIKLDSFAENFNFTSSGCGEPDGKGGHNRISDIAGFKSAVILKTYVFNSCNVSANVFQQKTNTFIIYPNPAKDVIWVKDIENLFSSLRIFIFDIYGRKLKTIDGRGYLSINISDFSEGLYYLKIENLNGEISSSYQIKICR
ncbi:MAG: T9SS type A sorting domain-containing protein [Bacteroidetes bacterium]|nr:T9SS type A sorting domain-containing protein [Bacteroidota bacterium]